MSTDTQIIEKAKGTMAKLILLVMVAPISITSIYYLFSTVSTNKENLAVIANGMDAIVVSMNENTKAIKAMDKDNSLGHGNIAEMVHGVKIEVARSSIRIDALSEELNEAKAHAEKHEANMPAWQKWRSKIDVHIDTCQEVSKRCQAEIQKLKDER